jgi:8-oxo-dGTP pyrophosphatase MutT (NUDIX family)
MYPTDLHERLGAALEPDPAHRPAPGDRLAGVLVPVVGGGSLVLTKRSDALSRHAGEISFPGGRRDHPDESLEATALREAEEEIGLDPAGVDVVGALPPIGTFVTSYKVHPFVGLIEKGLRFEPNPAEVESVLVASLDDLAAGFAKRRLVRRGVPIKTDTYTIADKMIWGATARILGELLERLDRSLR